MELGLRKFWPQQLAPHFMAQLWIESGDGWNFERICLFVFHIWSNWNVKSGKLLAWSLIGWEIIPLYTWPIVVHWFWKDWLVLGIVKVITMADTWASFFEKLTNLLNTHFSFSFLIASLLFWESSFFSLVFFVFPYDSFISTYDSGVPCTWLLSFFTSENDCVFLEHISFGSSLFAYCFAHSWTKYNFM